MFQQLSIPMLGSQHLRIYRSIHEPLRGELSWVQRWKGEDQGMITCWEVGRQRREEEPELAQLAENGELPPLPWKGGIAEKPPKPRKTKKVGTLYYLAMWQGLRAESLDVDLSKEPVMTCTNTEVKVIFTHDYNKYAHEAPEKKPVVSSKEGGSHE